MTTTATEPFSRDSWAGMYATRHLATDPGIQEICYLQDQSPENEIRLVEVNELLSLREIDHLEPIDFGVDIDGVHPHRLLVLDVTPQEWEQVKGGRLRLPAGWSMNEMKIYRQKI